MLAVGPRILQTPTLAEGGNCPSELSCVSAKQYCAYHTPVLHWCQKDLGVAEGRRLGRVWG